MKDRILESFFSSFCVDRGLKKDSTNFEHFVNYSLLSKYIPVYDLSVVHVADNGNYGIDGMAIIVNDCLVSTKEDLKYFLEKTISLRAEIIFIQTKQSDSFDSGEFLKFSSAIIDFITTFNTQTSQKIKDFHEIFNNIIDNSIKFQEISCSAYFSYTGLYQNSTSQNIIEQQKSMILDKNIFNNFYFEIIDSNSLKKCYRQIENTIENTIDATYLASIPLPQLDEVTEVFSGVISATDLINIITDDDKILLKTLFSDNVRDFQGMNPVNKDIQKTLQDPHNKMLFPVLNNGITIVASQAKRTRTNITLTNYQIVNGCQTCHILFYNKDRLDNIFVPVKIISSDSSETINSITKATNWQTQVTEEAFETTRDFHKDLEQIFLYFQKDRGYNLYYERRSKQYSHNSNIKKYQIITMPILLYSFISMFLDIPHSTHHYYGLMLKEHKKNIFDKTHNLSIYYLSAFLFNKVTWIISQQDIDNLKYMKYMFLYGFKILLWGGKKLKLNSNSLNNDVTTILNFLDDEKNLKKCFLSIAKCIGNCNRNRTDFYKLSSLKSFTLTLGEALEKERKEHICWLPQLAQ